ncbi:hypothetical protein KUCAC02_012262, partial [Chaenocephalus aceratus]
EPAVANGTVYGRQTAPLAPPAGGAEGFKMARSTPPHSPGEEIRCDTVVFAREYIAKAIAYTLSPTAGGDREMEVDMGQLMTGK